MFVSSADKLYKKNDQENGLAFSGADLDPHGLILFDNLSIQFRNRSDRTLYTDCN